MFLVGLGLAGAHVVADFFLGFVVGFFFGGMVVGCILLGQMMNSASKPFRSSSVKN